MAQPTGLDRNPQAYAIAECGQYETYKHQLITPQARMGKQASTWQHWAWQPWTPSCTSSLMACNITIIYPKLHIEVPNRKWTLWDKNAAKQASHSAVQQFAYWQNKQLQLHKQCMTAANMTRISCHYNHMQGREQEFWPDQLPGKGELDPDLLVDLVIKGLVELLGVVTLAVVVGHSRCLDDVE